MGIELIEHEDAGLLKIEYFVRLCPFRFIDDTGMEPADSSNSKIGIFVNFSLTIEKLHHAPEATQLVICLTFHVLVYNAFNRDIQYF